MIKSHIALAYILRETLWKEHREHLNQSFPYYHVRSYLITVLVVRIQPAPVVNGRHSEFCTPVRQNEQYAAYYRIHPRFTSERYFPLSFHA